MLVSLIDSIASIMNDGVSVSAVSQHTAGSEFMIDNLRETMNPILAEVNLSPIRSQTTQSIKNQSKTGLRRLVSKFTRESRALQGTLCVNRIKSILNTEVIKLI